ncbi:alpha/beta hydrolase [Enterobacter hormaechei]|uniref:alpha/beta fold hydrolase n=1 Tax=Enterobacter hormaechei TaxID=158836 RepID=UPI002DB9B67B|nr:alpha/beta hydrolase [Enterobacter hormaechei]MEB7375041.1 alpha/beta hydrolase [Enterobacter hormaechei]
MPEIYDHNGTPVKHMRIRVNGIRMHYVTAGVGEPLLLLHGTPKTHYYWHKVIPLLTDKFCVIAPDLRGFGDTDRPTAEEGYDSLTNAKDMSQLMEQLGHDSYFVHGEDRGAEFAYVLAATNRDKVKALSFCEMLLSGGMLEDMSFFSPENVNLQYNQNGVWQWHIPFFWIPHVPEMLIQGHEREFWEFWMKKETWNPNAIDQVCLDEWISHIKTPGGLRGVLETYRATFKNGDINKELGKEKLDMPVMTIGAPEFFGTMVEKQMKTFANKVTNAYVFEECGHSLALEAPDRLADKLRQFFLNAL